MAGGESSMAGPRCHQQSTAPQHPQLPAAQLLRPHYAVVVEERRQQRGQGPGGEEHAGHAKGKATKDEDQGNPELVTLIFLDIV